MTKVADYKQIGDKYRVVRAGTSDPLENSDGKAIDGGGYARPNYASQRAGEINTYYENLTRQYQEGVDE